MRKIILMSNVFFMNIPQNRTEDTRCKNSHHSWNVCKLMHHKVWYNLIHFLNIAFGQWIAVCVKCKNCESGEQAQGHYYKL